MVAGARHLRLTRSTRARTGLAAGGGGTPPVVEPPTLAELEPYRTSATSWVDILWGDATWPKPEGTRYQWVDVFLPSGTAPAGGWPAMQWFHPNGDDHKMLTAEHAALKSAALAGGYAVVSYEFRHPVDQVALGAPHLDAGRAMQWLRAFSAALGINPDKIVTACQSRGNLSVWQAMQPDLANPTGPTYASRQSSLFTAIWSYQGQTTYNTEQVADLAINPADRAAFLAAWGVDARWGSAISSVATAPAVPHLMMRHREAYPTIPMPWTEFDEHDPWFGMAMADAYAARGLSAKFTGLASITTGSAFAGAVAWCNEKLGISGGGPVEDPAFPLARSLAASIYDFSPDGGGVFTDTAGTTPASAAGALIARASDLTYTDHATQATAGSRPAIGTASGVTGAIFTADALYITRGTGASGYIGAALIVGAAGVNRDAICNGGNNAASRGVGIRRVTGGNIRFSWADGAVQGGINSSTAPAEGSVLVAEIVWTPTERRLYLNGSLAAEQTGSTVGLDSSTPIGFGINPALAGAWNGGICAAVVLPGTAPTPTQRATFGSWLAGQVGLTYAS